MHAVVVLDEAVVVSHMPHNLAPTLFSFEARDQ